MDKRREDIRDPAPETCLWLGRHNIYKEWQEKKRGLLWIAGKPGTGKSTLMKHALVSAQEAAGHRVLASYFFDNRSAQALQKSPLGMFRALLHQILQQSSACLEKMLLLFQDKIATQGPKKIWDWHVNELEKFFTMCVLRTSKVNPVQLYIDGLDECGETAAISLVQLFQELAAQGSHQGSVAICFSCRHYPILLPTRGLKITLETQNRHDIASYVKGRLAVEVSEGKDAERLAEAILKRDAGVFQWAQLVVSRATRDYQLGQTLGNIEIDIGKLPAELKEFYRLVMAEIPPADLSRTLELMRWLYCAFMPLSLAQLRHALAVDASTFHKSLANCRRDRSFIQNDKYMASRVVELSRGLAEIKSLEGQTIVQFMHGSVKDYLGDEGLRKMDGTSSCNDDAVGLSHSRISLSCLKYIGMEETETLLGRPEATNDQKVNRDMPLLLYAADHWHSHAHEAERCNVQLQYISRYLRLPLFRNLKKTLKVDYQIRLARQARKLRERPVHFDWEQEYSKGYREYSTHVNRAARRFPEMFAMQGLHSILDEACADIEAGMQSGQQITGDLQIFFNCAVRFDHVELVRKLLSLKRGVNVNSQTEAGLTLLTCAIRLQSRAMVELLLQQLEIDVNLADGLGQSGMETKNFTPLFTTAVVSVDMHKPLLEHPNVDVNLRSGGSNALYVALAESNVRLFQALLSREDIDLTFHCQNFQSQNEVSQDGKEADDLVIAAGQGHMARVRHFLQQTDSWTSEKSKAYKALHEAIRNGHNQIAKLILEKLPYQESNFLRLRHALAIAAARGNVDMVGLLIKRRDVDVNGSDEPGLTPLCWAIANGCEDVTRLLLSSPLIAVNKPSWGGIIPLWLAARKNLVSTVEKLLEHLALKVDQPAGDSSTAMWWATKMKHFAIRKLLLSRGATMIEPRDPTVDEYFVRTSQRLGTIVARRSRHSPLASVFEIAGQHGGSSSSESSSGRLGAHSPIDSI